MARSRSFEYIAHLKWDGPKGMEHICATVRLDWGKKPYCGYCLKRDRMSRGIYEHTMLYDCQRKALHCHG